MCGATDQGHTISDGTLSRPSNGPGLGSALREISIDRAYDKRDHPRPPIAMLVADHRSIGNPGNLEQRRL